MLTKLVYEENEEQLWILPEQYRFIKMKMAQQQVVTKLLPAFGSDIY